MAGTAGETDPNVKILARVPARTPTKLKMRLLDINGDPMSNLKCEITWAGANITCPNTDTNGVLEVAVPAYQGRAFLYVYAFKGEADPLTLELFPMDYGTPDQLPGARARLNNLGYEPLNADEAKPADALNQPLDEATKRGIQRFQNANHIVDAFQKSSGAIDAATSARLLSAHDTTDPLIK